ncbi:MAG: response regulator transcription factor [Crocinitomicaceae bacterium]|jgi:two-component system, LytTR family, response regulator|nr:response regulator transcription factor [Crocinitomicaceae bacterium]MBT6029238.1 response regulator transcription factor [Crocinitomicaceae bacterium]
MIRTIIVDDELLARENLKLLLSDFCENVEVVGEADSVDAAIDAITELKPTLVFLDIRMPSGIEGFELLERIDTKDFVVIFVTAFKDYAIKAFNANAIHYILKPIDVEDLQNALKKVTEYFKMKKSLPLKDFNYSELLENLTLSLKNDCPDRIAIHHSKGIKLVEVKEIVRLQANGNCTHIYFKNSSSYLDTRTLKTYEDLLPFYFVRIHKSHIVNINSVEEYVHTDGHRVILNDKSTAPISRGKLSEFLTLLKRM